MGETNIESPVDKRKKPIVGLSGGIGSGKSTVAGILEKLGAVVISSDRLNHEELNTPEVKTILRSWWDDEIIADGAVDRRKIAERIFGNAAERSRLEALVHPRIARRRDVILAEIRERPDVRMIVIDSPLLYEAGLDRMCDRVIYVEANEDNRRQRSEKDRQWPPGELARREKNQESLDNKRSRADHVCVNNSTPDALRQQVQDIYSKILTEFSSE